MPASQAFWDAAAPMIAVTEKHPFLVAMVDGTLAKDNFQYYVVQDAMYLQDFADCLRRLAQNPGVSETDSKRLDAFAKGAEDAEMALHNSFFKEWNISAEGVEQMPNCLLYTSYMKRIVVTKSHAQGLAVLLPCFWVYMHVGKCMLKLRDELGDRYVGWRYVICDIQSAALLGMTHGCIIIFSLNGCCNRPFCLMISNKIMITIFSV